MAGKYGEEWLKGVKGLGFVDQFRACQCSRLSKLVKFGLARIHHAKWSV